MEKQPSSNKEPMTLPEVYEWTENDLKELKEQREAAVAAGDQALVEKIDGYIKTDELQLKHVGEALIEKAEQPEIQASLGEDLTEKADDKQYFPGHDGLMHEVAEDPDDFKQQLEADRDLYS